MTEAEMDRVGDQPFWMKQLDQARAMPSSELRRHADVSVRNRHSCRMCFCCAAVVILKGRGEL